MLFSLRMLWFTGGLYLKQYEMTQETFLHDPKNEYKPFKKGPKLPFPMAFHCSLAINDTHVFLAGGFNEEISHEFYFFYDWMHHKWIEVLKIDFDINFKYYYFTHTDFDKTQVRNR